MNDKIISIIESKLNHSKSSIVKLAFIYTSSDFFYPFLFYANVWVSGLIFIINFLHSPMSYL